MITKIQAFFCSVAILFFPAVAHWSKKTSSSPPHIRSVVRDRNDVPTVDRFTREMAAKLDVQDIKELRFTGLQFMRFEDNPIVIRDKAEIGRYVAALRHAYDRPMGICNRIDDLEIVFQPHKGEETPSQYLHFNLVYDLDSFGPEFHKEALALQARVAEADKKVEPVRTQPAPAIPTVAFGIATVSSNETLSDEVPVNVTTSRDYTYGDVTLKVDGKVVGWGGSTLVPNGPGLVPFSLWTAGFPNGRHTITVQDNLGNADTRTVRFDNRIGNLDVTPIFDTTPGVKDIPSQCAISCTFEGVQPWTVRVQTCEDMPFTLRTYSGKSASVRLSWDGKDSRGEEVLSGDAYEVVVICPQQTLKCIVNKNSLGKR